MSQIFFTPSLRFIHALIIVNMEAHLTHIYELLGLSSDYGKQEYIPLRMRRNMRSLADAQSEKPVEQRQTG